MSKTADASDLFDSFNIEELDVMEVAGGVALPEMGASTAPYVCCSSSSGCCC